MLLHLSANQYHHHLVLQHWRVKYRHEFAKEQKFSKMQKQGTKYILCVFNFQMNHTKILSQTLQLAVNYRCAVRVLFWLTGWCALKYDSCSIMMWIGHKETARLSDSVRWMSNCIGMKRTSYWIPGGFDRVLSRWVMAVFAATSQRRLYIFRFPHPSPPSPGCLLLSRQLCSAAVFVLGAAERPDPCLLPAAGRICSQHREPEAEGLQEGGKVGWLTSAATNRIKGPSEPLPHKLYNVLKMLPAI